MAPLKRSSLEEIWDAPVGAKLSLLIPLPPFLCSTQHSGRLEKMAKEWRQRNDFQSWNFKPNSPFSFPCLHSFAQPDHFGRLESMAKEWRQRNDFQGRKFEP